MLIRVLLIILLLSYYTPSALALSLQQRMEQYPNWQDKPPTQLPSTDLIYPKWIEGKWQVVSILVDMVAPLAPEVVTPGFEGNRRHLNQPINFPVKFIPNRFKRSPALPTVKEEIVSDRAFNAFSIAKTYLQDQVLGVKLSPDNPNRQITFLKGDTQLIATITGRSSQVVSPREFIATEIFQQQFRSPTQIYINEVESTTDYHMKDGDTIEAHQVSAIYLSPQDPSYFKANNHPVALYRYQLNLAKIPNE